MNRSEKRFKTLQHDLSKNGVLLHPNRLLFRASRLWPDQPALTCEEKTVTFKQLALRVAFLAKKLKTEFGLQPGDRVLVLYENSIDFYIAYHAAWILGTIVAPLNIFLTEVELKHIINDSRPKLIITSPGLCEKIAVQTNTPQLCENLWELTKDAPVDSLDFEPISPQLTDCTLLLYTSGTTGLPKGVMLSGEAIVTNCIQGIANFNITKREKLFAPLPLFHSYMQNTNVWCALIIGAEVIIVPRISRPALIAGLAKKPTIILGIPQLFGLFCLMKNISFPKARILCSGGDALHPSIKMGFELRFNRRLINGFGLTETCPLVAANLVDVHAPTHSVGKPFLGITVEIRDEEERPVKQGIVGTIWVKGKNVMLGYYNAPEATAAVIKGEWLNTGDMGYLETDGSLVLAGREKDLIIHNGMKIYPQEIESILSQHPAVMMAAVVGKKKDKNETPVAFVVPTQDHPEHLETILKNHCRQHLAAYKVPNIFYLKASLPLTATGKIDKKVLRAMLTSEILE